MAAPNLLNITTVTGKTTAYTPINTNTAVLINNPASSNKVFKINSILATNVSNAAANASVSLYTNAGVNQGGSPSSGTTFQLVANVSVPSTATLIVIDKASAFYLEEANSIVVTSGTANATVFSVSYEDIS